MKQRSVVLTGNCNVGGIVDALAALVPEIDLRGIPAWELETREAIDDAKSAIADAHVWLRMPLPVNQDLAGAVPRDEIFDLPNLVFTAFHPDAIYATIADGNIFRGLTDYHSAIGLWAWRRGLEPGDAARLFTPDVMLSLTYDKYWDPSVVAMRQDFASSSLDFLPFWLRLKRTGVFMHTINHPTAGAVALLGKAIAIKLGAPASVWDEPTERYTQDFLSHIVWPVYPWVGTALGVPGCSRWKMNGEVYPDVASWLEATWTIYEGTAPDSILSPRIDDGVYDAVLGAALDALGSGSPR